MGNNEVSEDLYQRHTAKENENYYLTLLDDLGLKTINLLDFNKDKISFGTSFKNDIVIDSNQVDDFQGYFSISEHGVLAINSSEKYELIGKDNKPIDQMYLAERSFVKIMDNDGNGIVFIMSISNALDEWKKYTLPVGTISIGSDPNCEIILNSIGIKKVHAKISYSKSEAFIKDENTLNGLFLNGSKVFPMQKKQLNNLDVIYIGNAKMIYRNGELYYQTFKNGVTLEAVDIVKNVCIKFKKKQISSHINMKINPSEFVAFVGASGAGKSVFLKSISGVTPPTSGKVLFNGQDLYENYEALKKNIGYVPQDDIVYPNLTLFDTLYYSAKLRLPRNTKKKEIVQRIYDVIDIVELKGLENTFIRQLSGGQRKRACIAVELIADPSLFFLDEPTSGLDPGTERNIMYTLKELCKSGKTVILVTHNTLNLHLCDKIAFMGKGGHLCFYGAPSDALKFFGVDDFVDIYNLIDSDAQVWSNKYKEEVESETIDITANDKYKIEDDEQIKPKIKKPKNIIHQVSLLIQRQIKLIVNNPVQLILLFAQSPIIALLLTFVAGENVYVYFNSTKAILFAISCACIWLGLLNSVQEICKEKVILHKEYMANLRLISYIISKFIVQTFLALMQATIITTIFLNRVGTSEYSILFGSYGDMLLITFITILAASSLGLLISALVKNSDIAIPLVPIVIIPQLLFSGMLFSLKGFTKFISAFVLCRWAMEGLGTSTNINELKYYIESAKIAISFEAEDYYTFTTEHFIRVIIIICAMILIQSVASCIVLKRNIKKQN